MKAGHIFLAGLGIAALAVSVYYFLVYKKNEPIKAAAKSISLPNKYAEKRAGQAIKKELKDINTQVSQTVKSTDFFTEEERLLMATEAAKNKIV